MAHIIAFIFIVLGALSALVIYFAVELHKQAKINEYNQEWLAALSNGFSTLKELYFLNKKDVVSCEENNNHDEATEPVQDR
jgi:hypothetical protein